MLSAPGRSAQTLCSPLPTTPSPSHLTRVGVMRQQLLASWRVTPKMSTVLSAFIWYNRQSREISVPIWLMSPLQGTRGVTDARPG